MMEKFSRLEWDAWNIAHISRPGVSVEDVKSAVSGSVVGHVPEVKGSGTYSPRDQPAEKSAADTLN